MSAIVEENSSKHHHPFLEVVEDLTLRKGILMLDCFMAFNPAGII